MSDSRVLSKSGVISVGCFFLALLSAEFFAYGHHFSILKVSAKILEQMSNHQFLADPISRPNFILRLLKNCVFMVTIFPLVGFSVEFRCYRSIWQHGLPNTPCYFVEHFYAKSGPFLTQGTGLWLTLN